MHNKNIYDEFSISLEGTELGRDEITRMAYETRFCCRNTGKINAPDFLILMCLESVKGSPSYNDLAARHQSTCGTSVSRQALWKRSQNKCLEFFQRILSRVMHSKITDVEKEMLKKQSRYKRILVQDSTVIRIPLRLFDDFSGVKNAHSAVCNARIQGVYDLLSGKFIDFSVDSYSKNDLTAAPELELLEGDLVLRDRGYLTYDEIQRHRDAGADCIYRHKLQNTYLDPTTKKKINLAEELGRNGKIDREVLLNNFEKTKIRIVAAPVKEEVANLRRMKTKKEAKGHNPSAELLYLMSWTIFTTTIPADKASFKEVLALYRLRWRIENIFKTWKSSMNFAAVHNVSNHQLRVLLAARLIVIVICNHRIFQHCLPKIRKDYDKELSMMKIIKYLASNLKKIPQIIMALRGGPGDHRELFGALARYCTYDKRKRLNYKQLEESAIMGLALG